jgi:hypothetical protein
LIDALASKLQILSNLVVELSSAEFIWLLLISLILLLAGAGIEIYQFRAGQELGKSVRETGIKLVSMGMDT